MAYSLIGVGGIDEGAGILSPSSLPGSGGTDGTGIVSVSGGRRQGRGLCYGESGDNREGMADKLSDSWLCSTCLLTWESLLSGWREYRRGDKCY